MPRTFLYDCNIVGYISGLEIFKDFFSRFLSHSLSNNL